MESGGPDNITVYNMITRPAPVLGTVSDNVFNIRLNKYLRNQTYYEVKLLIPSPTDGRDDFPV